MPRRTNNATNSLKTPPGVGISELLGVSDDRLIAHVCRWMANQTETGNGSASAEDRRDNRARMARMGKDTSGLPADAKDLTPHDQEYVRRLREIAKRFETPNTQLTDAQRSVQ